MEVFLIFPKSQQAKQELAQELAKFQSEQVLKNVQKLPCSTEQKLELVDAASKHLKAQKCYIRKRADRHGTPVCTFCICFSLNLAPQGSYRAARFLQAPAERKVSHADRLPPTVFWIPPVCRRAHRKAGRLCCLQLCAQLQGFLTLFSFFMRQIRDHAVVVAQRG